jgi:hypothetical protein
VTHQLASLCAGRTEAHSINHVVEATLQQLEQILARVSPATNSVGVIPAELSLEDAIDSLDLLLLAKLLPEI